MRAFVFHFSALMAWIAFLCGALSAQNTSLPFQTPDRVEVEPVETVTVVPGHQTPMEFRFRVRQGFHINSHQPSSPELKPTELRFSLPAGLIVAQVKYPAGTPSSFPFDPDTKISVYSGEVVVKAMAMAQNREMAGPYNIHGELFYQACDDRSCFPPKRLPFTFNINVGKPPRHRR